MPSAASSRASNVTARFLKLIFMSPGARRRVSVPISCNPHARPQRLRSHLSPLRYSYLRNPPARRIQRAEGRIHHAGSPHRDQKRALPVRGGRSARRPLENALQNRTVVPPNTRLGGFTTASSSRVPPSDVS